MEEQKKIGRMEGRYPYLYAFRQDYAFNVYELNMIKHALAFDQLEYQKIIDHTTDDNVKFDMLEMKLKRAELGERVADMIAAATEKKPS